MFSNPVPNAGLGTKRKRRVDGDCSGLTIESEQVNSKKQRTSQAWSQTKGYITHTVEPQPPNGPQELFFTDSLRLGHSYEPYMPDVCLNAAPNQAQQLAAHTASTPRVPKCKDMSGSVSLDKTLLLSPEETSKTCADFQPCNNPTCEDVQPCTANLDPCLEPQQCLGNICYNSNCVDEDEGFEFKCDGDCETATRCATPCYGDECGVPACQAPCPSSLAITSQYHDTGHQQIGQQILCNAPGCDIPGIQCVDPRCLSLDYTPAAPIHVHHGLDDFCRYSGLSPFATVAPAPEYPGLGKSRVNWIPNNSQRNTSEIGFMKELEGFDPTYITTNSLQPLVDWNNANSPYQNNETFPDSNPYFLKHRDSVNATPDMPASQSLRSTSVFSSTVRSENVCLWMLGAGSEEGMCGAIFDNASELHAHLEKSHIEKLQRDPSARLHEGYYCRWRGCSRNTISGRPAAFAARPKLKRHAQTHTLHKPFVCPTCGARMKTKDAMEKHERTHSGERPYACSVDGCHKIFATSTELKTHMVVHSGRKPHECPICGEGFADSSNLSKHKKTHYVGMYKCPDVNCGARMKRWDQMRRHMTSQGHATELLNDAERQRQYKMQMEWEWRVLPEEEKLIGVGSAC